jgi:hypothetical protein
MHDLKAVFKIRFVHNYEVSNKIVLTLTFFLKGNTQKGENHIVNISVIVGTDAVLDFQFGAKFYLSEIRTQMM